MLRKYFFTQNRFIASLLVWALSGAATGAEVIPLNKGVYVIQGVTPCEQAPLAAVQSYNGKAISGAHEAGCHMKMIKRINNIYRIMQSCDEAGDGTFVGRNQSLK